ncbi:hypothetical protein LUZ63_004016 [Rhynchospora breviuscula]|uniref:KIB1-4 beta-propeller domain-containing protein n=1 Tax=Rhynchospora breviuscula TaxID=2022672 RepID=A0A9Q0D1R6_9POAL|nr:hypothetical protein LUZ63_004016 [Rhynchospora breviuscula]
MTGEILGCKVEDYLPRCFGSWPWLFQMHGSKKKTCTFFDPINNSLEERILPEFLQRKACLGCYGEWILLADELTRECFFLSITSFSRIYIPSFPESPDFLHAVVSITSPPNTSNCIVILVCSEKTFLLVCSPGRKKWKKVPLKYFNKNVGSLRGPSIIYNEQLFVMVDMTVTLVIDVAPLIRGCVKMIVIDEFKPCPILYSWYTYFVECAGDLFLIIMHSYGYGQLIINFEVRRLELSCNSIHWRRVQDIGDHAFFLAGCSGRSFPANKAWGVQPNCIYTPAYYSDGVRLYKMQAIEEDTCNLSDVMRSSEEDFSVVSKEDENEIDILRRWNELSIELVELLFPRLSLVDCLRLLSVCQGWTTASSFIRKGRVWPWLMHLPNLKYQSCKFFDPFYCEEYTL